MSLHAQHIPRTELVDMALGGTHSVGGRVSCLRLGTLDVDPVVGLLNFDISTISEGFTDNLFLSTFKCPFNKAQYQNVGRLSCRLGTLCSR